MTQKGFFEKYFINPIFINALQTRGVIRSKDVKLTFAAWGIVTLGIFGVLIGLVGLLGPEVGFISMGIGCGLWIIWSAIALINLTMRRASSTDINSDSENGKAVVLPIDKLLTGVSILFFIFGILMMTTTLASGELNLGPRSFNSDEENPILNSDKIEEEAIFTYQETPSVGQDENTVDNDSAYLQESFDPAATSPTAENDTTYID